jgi:hypothetical protein
VDRVGRFFLAWGVPWLAGGWWRDRSARGFHEQRTGLVLAVAATGAAAVLVHAADYAPRRSTPSTGRRSNTTPPTRGTAVVALAQVGVLLLGARWLDAAGRRWRRLWDRAGEAAVGVYLCWPAFAGRGRFLSAAACSALFVTAWLAFGGGPHHRHDHSDPGGRAAATAPSRAGPWTKSSTSERFGTAAPPT